MKTIAAFSLVLLAACASPPPTASPVSPAPSAIVTPATTSLVGKWSLDDTSYEFTGSGTFVSTSGTMALTGKYEALSGGKLLMRYDSGSQYIYTYSLAGDKLTVTTSLGTSVYTKTP
jgi:hypothetical protein